MKVIDLGDVPAQLNGSLVTYQQAQYRYRVKLPVSQPIVSITEVRAGRSSITFSSLKGGVLTIIGRTEFIESIFQLVGGKGAK